MLTNMLNALQPHRTKPVFTLPTLFRYPFNTYITVFSLATDTVVTKGIYKKVLPKS